VYAKRKAAKSDKENQPPPQAGDAGADPEDEDRQGCRDLSNLTLDTFLTSLGSTSRILSLEANVDIASLEGNTPREKADELVKRIGEELKYRFMCVPLTSRSYLTITQI
jgi:hypothetical protein